MQYIWLNWNRLKLFIFHVRCYSRTVISRLLWLTFHHLICQFHIFQYAWLYCYLLFVFERQQIALDPSWYRPIIRYIVFINHTVLHFLLPINHTVHKRLICTSNSHISCFDLIQNVVITGQTRLSYCERRSSLSGLIMFRNR